MICQLVTPDGAPALRSPDEAFAGLADFDFTPRYIAVEGALRMAYIDVGPADGPVAVLLHGMPTWSFLNRHIIAGLVAAGWRCIAPDHIGFGRSDKVTDESWYSIARHARAHAMLMEVLGLTDITLFVQDWGGPIGLMHAAAHPDRYARLVIMNTWLHHPDYDYTPALRQWNQQWQAGGLFRETIPQRLSIGWFMMLATGRMTPKGLFAIINDGVYPALSAADGAVQRAYDAPFADLGEAGLAGPRRFPLSLPFFDPAAGAAEAQAEAFAALKTWSKPIHFIWGGADAVFTEAWGRRWASLYPQARFDLLPDAAHFLQDTHGGEIARLVLTEFAR